MSVGVSGVGGSMPTVVSGASMRAAASQGASTSGGGQAAAPTGDFSSTIEALLKTLENAGPGSTGGNLNTYV